jgi:hypothetical protein
MSAKGDDAQLPIIGDRRGSGPLGHLLFSILRAQPGIPQKANTRKGDDQPTRKALQQETTIPVHTPPPRPLD